MNNKILDFLLMIASPHFHKYKQGTLHMVKSLELCDQNPLNPESKLLKIK